MDGRVRKRHTCKRIANSHLADGRDWGKAGERGRERRKRCTRETRQKVAGQVSV